MNYDWAFLPMRSSIDLLGDPAALRERLADDSYLYFPQLIPTTDVLDVRRDMIAALSDIGWIRPDPDPMLGRAAVNPCREGDDEYFRANDAVQRVESFHTLAHHPRLVAAMQDVLGPSAFPHPLKIARLVFADHHEAATPPHQDFPNNQGTDQLTAAWVPLGDVPSEMGGLAVLRGSHRRGMLPLTRHLGAGNRCAVLPQDLLEQCRWVTTEFTAGDVLIFPSLTVHAARYNSTIDQLRLSVDFRYQLEGQALTAGCLEPHFQRLTWDEIYEGWSSDRHQYYWRDLDFEVTEFEEFDLVQTATDEEIIAEHMRQEMRRKLRRQRS